MPLCALFQTWLFAIFARKRPFALFCGLAFAIFCAHLRSFASFCVRPHLEHPRLGTADPRETHTSMKTRAAIYRSLWALHARNRKRASLGGLQISPRKYPKKSQMLGKTPTTPGTFRKKFWKISGNALRAFPGNPLESTAGIPQTL